MTLKFEVENLDGLDDSVKSLYVEKDGKFTLGIDGIPANNNVANEARIAAMDGKIAELLSEKKSESAKRKAAEIIAAKEIEEAARASGDVDALDKSWTTKYEASMSESTGTIDALKAENKSMLDKFVIEKEAMSIMAKLDIFPESQKLTLPAIKRRIGTDGVKPTYLDADGNISALTREDLYKEFDSDPAFMRMRIGSHATGGGADGSNQGGGAVKPTGNMGGSRSERQSAISGMFPDLK